MDPSLLCMGLGTSVDVLTMDQIKAKTGATATTVIENKENWGGYGFISSSVGTTAVPIAFACPIKYSGESYKLQAWCLYMGSASSWANVTWIQHTMVEKSLS